MKLEKAQSMLMKADERLMLSCFGMEDRTLSDIRGAVYRKLKERVIDLRGDTLGIDGYRVAYDVIFISDKDGVRCDRRTLPKELKPWVDCPYDLPLLCDVDELSYGKYHCVISYKMCGGTYEYPNEFDLYLNLHRIEKEHQQ